MSEKITKLVKELQEKHEELQSEISNLSKTNLSLLDDLKKKFEWDDVIQIKVERMNGLLLCPSLSLFLLGYNIFKINQYTQWLGDMPDFLRKELNIEERIFVSDGNLVFTEGKEDEVKDRYGDLLSSVSKGTARVKLGKEFDLIAKIIENGSLPFVPRQVEEKDIIKIYNKGRTEATQEIINFIENTFEGLDENWIMKKTIIKKFQEGK